VTPANQHWLPPHTKVLPLADVPRTPSRTSSASASAPPLLWFAPANQGRLLYLSGHLLLTYSFLGIRFTKRTTILGVGGTPCFTARRYKKFSYYQHQIALFCIFLLQCWLLASSWVAASRDRSRRGYWRSAFQNVTLWLCDNVTIWCFQYAKNSQSRFLLLYILYIIYIIINLIIGAFCTCEGAKCHKVTKSQCHKIKAPCGRFTIINTRWAFP